MTKIIHKSPSFFYQILDNKWQSSIFAKIKWNPLVGPNEDKKKFSTLVGIQKLVLVVLLILLFRMFNKLRKVLMLPGF